MLMDFFFNDTATTEIYTLSLHDALPIWVVAAPAAPGRRPDGARDYDSASWNGRRIGRDHASQSAARGAARDRFGVGRALRRRSEEHTSELQSRQYLVCRLLLEKKKHTLE